MSLAECSETKISSQHPTSNLQQAVTTHACPMTPATSQPTIMAGLLRAGNVLPYALNTTSETETHPISTTSLYSKHIRTRGKNPAPTTAPIDCCVTTAPIDCCITTAPIDCCVTPQKAAPQPRVSTSPTSVPTHPSTPNKTEFLLPFLRNSFLHRQHSEQK